MWIWPSGSLTTPLLLLKSVPWANSKSYFNNAFIFRFWIKSKNNRKHGLLLCQWLLLWSKWLEKWMLHSSHHWLGGQNNSADCHLHFICKKFSFGEISILSCLHHHWLHSPYGGSEDGVQMLCHNDAGK